MASFSQLDIVILQKSSYRDFEFSIFRSYWFARDGENSKVKKSSSSYSNERKRFIFQFLIFKKVPIVFFYIIISVRETRRVLPVSSDTWVFRIFPGINDVIISWERVASILGWVRYFTLKFLIYLINVML